MDNDSSGETAASSGSPFDGRYRVLGRLGSGGMADVFLAEDEVLGRRVAVKVLKREMAADAEFVERFRIEAQAAASLNHANIVAVHDRGRADGRPYIVMEYVDGESLKQRLRRGGALAPDEAVGIALAVLGALGAAHARRIVHRDVTSYNVLLDDSGHVKVADFGIARVGGSSLTRSGVMMGTSSYLSPEQAQGRPADPRSDVYSAGVVLFEMLTGRLPFTGENDIAVAMQHVSAAPPNPRSLVSGVPEAYAAVVMKALSKRPDDRYQGAAAFADALRAATGAAARRSPPPPTSRARPASEAYTAPVLARVAPPVVAPARRPHRRRRAWIVAGCAALAAAATAAVFVLVGDAGPVMPAVVGMQRGQAVDAVRGEGLRPSVHTLWADGYDAGLVTRQRPRADTRVDEGARVDLWVSRGPLHIPSPDLTGLRPAQATELLVEQSLTGHKRRAATRRVPKGTIYRQEPQAGDTVARGDSVTYWVSTGPPIVAVPDVVGLSSGDAEAVLLEAGFTVNTDLVAGWGAVPGDVVGQDPPAGTRLRKGDEVVIQVAVF